MKAKWFLVALALASTPGWALADRAWREQSRREVPADGLSTLVVDNARGRIDVRPSADGKLRITALKIARAATEAEAKKIAATAAVELQRDGARYVVKVKYPRKESVHVNFWEGFDLSVPRLEVRLAVEVPAALAVQLHASSGDIFTQDLRGEQRLRASSGDVSVDGATGPVDVVTSSGDVELMDPRSARVTTSSGDVEISGSPNVLAVSTSSGDVDIDDVSDSIRVETTSGDVSIESAARGATVSTSSGEVRIGSTAGRLSITTVSGEIKTHVTAPLQDATFVTSSGDIRLGLDSRVGCRVEMRTSSGSLDLGVPVRTQTLTRRLVTGVIRDGSAPVRMKSASGSIAVVSGEP
ncbi:MAG TPA: DUF4097 family beta strand repeat-containing protein [Candidatus Eisenbacteria bacterium]|nr:DUF4097 family beta strand repeat-containing protein [Candidatus Eisenbacteria bacterium]